MKSILFLIMIIFVSCSSLKNNNIESSNAYEYLMNSSNFQGDFLKFGIDTFVLVKIATWEGERICLNFGKNGVEFAKFLEQKANDKIKIFPNSTFFWEYFALQKDKIVQSLSKPWTSFDTLTDENGRQLVKEIPCNGGGPYIEVVIKFGEMELKKKYYCTNLPAIYQKEPEVWMLINHLISGSL